MREAILTQLSKIESDHGVVILYACESGSRAWGFPSVDSDYDVRFFYVHPVDWYLSIQAKRDVIELKAEDNLDINGWDIQKALGLFRKSNPPLLEWLGSPIVYLERHSLAARLRGLAKQYYSSANCIFHYLHMADGNFREYLHGEEVWLKKYFYVLRPILAIKWIEQGLGVAPTAFGNLAEKTIVDLELKRAIDLLIEKKSGGDELARGPRIPVISDFIESELARIQNEKKPYQDQSAPISVLDELFVQNLVEAWGYRQLP
jgi:hypothetical protein